MSATTGDDGTVTIATFIDDDAGYLAWLTRHPGGYVLNAERTPRASYLKLHRVGCRSISGRPAAGDRWTADYIKVCAEDAGTIEEWARRETGALPDRCLLCG